MADDADSKSVARKGVWVQVPLSAGRIPVVVPELGEQPGFILLARSFAQHAGGGCGSVDGAELPAYTYGEHGNTQRR